jgi:hypothetical protein
MNVYDKKNHAMEPYREEMMLFGLSQTLTSSAHARHAEF